MLTVPVEAYTKASAVTNSVDAIRLITTYVIPDRTCSRPPPSVSST